LPSPATDNNGQLWTLQGITVMNDSTARHTTDHRLDSWKEIAAFFGRGERTVRRWEKERGLPAHRVPGGARGGVFAYTTELREWLKGPGTGLAAAEESGSPATEIAGDHPAAGTNQTGMAQSPVLDKGFELRLAPPSPENPPVGPRASSPASQATPRIAARIVARVAPLAVVAILILVVSISHRETRYKNARAAPHQPNPEAQELYLKGEYHRTKLTPDDLNKAVDYFTQSIVKDPSYAQAYVGLADCYNLLREYSVMPPEEAYPRALAAAQKAVELDDTLASAHTSLAFPTFYWNWDAAVAEREYERALELDANFAQGHHWYATFLLISARFPEALKQIELARKLDPSSTAIQADKGLILFDSGRKAESFALLEQLASTDPTLATTHSYLAKIYFDRQDYANFFVESKLSAQLRHDEAGLAIANAAEKGFAAGGLDGMREAMLPLQKENVDRGTGPAYDLAATYASLGRKEEALRYLQTSFDRRETGMLYLSRNPGFNGLHDDLAYQKIVEQVGARLSQSAAP
jgi:Tfp pilus assembly protein PilF